MPRHRPAPTLATLSFALLLAHVGCGVGGHVGRGISYYQEQDYVSAMQVWVELQSHQHAMNGKGRVRYLVFRGLTHYRRGEQAMARHFLIRGQHAYRLGPPGWLPHRARIEMDQALATLGGARGDSRIGARAR